MSALLLLTLIYAAVLVVALAAGLIAILYFLNRARSDLRKIASGLARADANVEPLKTGLTAVNADLEIFSTHLETANRDVNVTAAILGLWWTFLVAAAIVTVVDVYLLARVIRLARGVSLLTRRTLPAAAGIVENTAVRGHLGATRERVGALREEGASIAKLAVLLAAQLSRKGS